MTRIKRKLPVFTKEVAVTKTMVLLILLGFFGLPLCCSHTHTTTHFRGRLPQKKEAGRSGRNCLLSPVVSDYNGSPYVSPGERRS